MEVVVRGFCGFFGTTTSTLLPSDIVTREHVLNVLAGAMKKASAPGLDTCEFIRLNVLLDASTTYDAVKAKLKRLKERPETTLPIYRGRGSVHSGVAGSPADL